MSSTNAGTSVVGRGVPRKEDWRLLTGNGRYIADVELPRTLHVAFVRSPHAHALINRVDTRAALALPGVVAVFTGEQLSRLVKPIRTQFSGTTYRESDWPVLALGKVRFVGEPVAAVVAGDRYVAEDSCELVEVDYEPLPAVVTVEDALAPGAPIVQAELPDNLYVDESKEFGSVDDRLSGAAAVVEATFRTQRSAPAPLECRGALAEYDASAERLTLWTSTQVPHVARYGIARCLQVREDQVRLISPDVGGGFGNKASMDPEQVVVSALARALGRPVKWIEDRRENFIASDHAHEERVWLRLSADAEGRFRTLEADIVLNGGAYSIFPDTPCCEALVSAANLVGPYRFANFRYRSRAVVTSTCPHGPYRAMGRVSAYFALERLVDVLARRLGMDPVDVRRANLLGPADFPHRTVTGLDRDSGDYVKTLDLAVESLEYREFKARQAAWREQGRLVGVGVACYAEDSATGTVSRAPGKQYAIAGYDGATVRIEPHGRVTVFSSAATAGQGHETSLAQLAADELGADVEAITVHHGDTGVVPYGMGSTGSRTAVSAGGAVVLAARKLKEKLLWLGSHLLETPVEHLAIRRGEVYAPAQPERAVSFERLAWVAYRREGTVPAGFEPGLEAVAFYDPPSHGVSSNAAHAVAVEIDPATGQVAILRYVVAEDTGRMINPVIVEGQVVGGVVQGIGKALYEEVRLDEQGQMLNASFLDFLMPTSQAVGSVEVVYLETPSPLSVGGIKGCGEGGIIGPPPAIGNAIADALGGGAELYEPPFTPERVWRLVNGVSDL